MSAPTPAKQHRALVVEIRRHDEAYYQQAAPLVSDQEYDRLYRELLDLETAHPELRTADSPSQRVGGEPLPHFITVAHAVPMQSLDNTYSATELEAFHDRVQKALEGQDLSFVIEPKATTSPPTCAPSARCRSRSSPTPRCSRCGARSITPSPRSRS
jgi:DNA ligase (NAD+)